MPGRKKKKSRTKKLKSMTPTTYSQNDESMIRAVMSGGAARLSKAEQIIRSLDDVDQRDRFGSTALHNSAAASAGSEEIATLLIDRGADVEAMQRPSGKRPLHLAAVSGYLKLAQLLLIRGADPRSTDLSGDTPLHFAALHGHPDVVRLLLSKGADPNTCPKDRAPPLHCAVLPNRMKTDTERIRVVKMLLRAGADPNLRNGDGHTSAQVAARLGVRNVAKLIIEQSMVIMAAPGERPTAPTAAAIVKKGSSNGSLMAYLGNAT